MAKMFACIYFKEDASLSVVGIHNKNLEVLGEFKERTAVKMKWKTAGTLKMFNGTIVKIHENEEFLAKFATAAYNKHLKGKKEKPCETPEELYAFQFEIVATKRQRAYVTVDSEKSKKTKVKNVHPKTAQKNATVVTDNITSSDIIQVVLQQTDLDSQFSDGEKEETISNKPQIPAPQVSATEVHVPVPKTQVPVLTSQVLATQSRDSQVSATQSTDSQVSAATSWPQSTDSQVSAAPSWPQSTDSQVSAAPSWPQSTDSQVSAAPSWPQSTNSQVSAASSWQWNNRYQQYNNQQYNNQHNQQHNPNFQLQSNWPAQSNNYQQTLTTPLPVREETSWLTHPFNYMDRPQLQISQQLPVSPEDSETALPVPPAEMVEVFRSLAQPIVQKYMKEVCNYHDNKNKTFHELQKIPNCTTSIVPLEPDFEEWTPSYTRIASPSPPPIQFRQKEQPRRTSPRKFPKESPAYSPRKSPRKTPKKSPRKAIPEKSKNTMLIKLIDREGITVAADIMGRLVERAPTESSPGYFLTRKLMAVLFTKEEMANSRGQGLQPQREGDMRPPLDKTRVNVIKDYARGYCKKHLQKLPGEEELNKGITEAIGYARKNIKKLLQKK